MPDERSVTWWLWRTASGELVPVATDENGRDWPDLSPERQRALAVEELLRAHVPIRPIPPALTSHQLRGHVVGSSAFVTMLLAVGVALLRPLPDVLNAAGALGFLLAPIATSLIVSHRRIGRLPPELQPLAREAVRDFATAVAPVRWRWLGSRFVLFLVSIALLLVLVIVL